MSHPILTAPKVMPAQDTPELMEASHSVQSCSSPILFLVQPSSPHSPQAAFPAQAGRGVFQGKHGFMEVSSEEETAHVLGPHKGLCMEIGWFRWNLLEMSPLPPGETPKNQEGQVFP